MAPQSTCCPLFAWHEGSACSVRGDVLLLQHRLLLVVCSKAASRRWGEGNGKLVLCCLQGQLLDCTQSSLWHIFYPLAGTEGNSWAGRICHPMCKCCRSAA